MSARHDHAGEALDLDHRLHADSVGGTLELLGERWTMMILREAFFGVRRYGELARNLEIPRPTLSLRLRRLVDAGVLDRVLYSAEPERHEYTLTHAGRDLFPAVIALMRWGDTYLAGPRGAPIVLRHERCGKRTRPRLTCGECGEELTTRNVTPERGHGFRDLPATGSNREETRR
ncbi:MAG TPA: helix-turn-helix domain-containing protein [Solirubrobacteraceae bacterium]|jgi:DNA-binding HxlR family transcriptional regulator|nr:helix-turn-helix domain-containing protein [Solirubrobacteraceae bacterium]